MESGHRDTNRKLLNEATEGRLWFHAVKTRPIWARRLEQPETIRTLEGDQQAPAGSFLCRGEAGDIWPQTAERLHAKYHAAAEPPADGWQKYLPQPAGQGVMAARIEHPFIVHAPWGELQGKAGDYLVKNFEDGENPDPEDVWLVDQALFTATYAPLKAEPGDVHQ